MLLDFLVMPVFTHASYYTSQVMTASNAPNRQQIISKMDAKTTRQQGAAAAAAAAAAAVAACDYVYDDGDYHRGIF